MTNAADMGKNTQHIYTCTLVAYMVSYMYRVIVVNLLYEHVWLTKIQAHLFSPQHWNFAKSI